MLGLNFSIPPGPPGWAGVQRSSPVNWSAYDRLVLWIEPTASSLPLSFNVTAYVGSNLYQTAPRDLVAGWQEIPVDLTAFGPVRDSLVSVTLRVNGNNISGGQVFFDDLRVGNAKRFDEVAAIRQAVAKANATTPAAGSAVLQLNWSLPSETGVASVQAVVNVSGPSGTAINRFSAPPATGWHRFLADVSSTSSLAGLYNVSVGIRVVADNTSGSAVEVRVDDVSIPSRTDRTARTCREQSRSERLPSSSKSIGPSRLPRRPSCRPRSGAGRTRALGARTGEAGGPGPRRDRTRRRSRPGRLSRCKLISPRRTRASPRVCADCSSKAATGRRRRGRSPGRSRCRRSMCQHSSIGLGCVRRAKSRLGPPSRIRSAMRPIDDLSRPIKTSRIFG